MNFKIFKQALLLLILAAITGCNNEKPDASEQNERIPVNLTADIKPASTLKVANDQWESNDKVGLYMKKAGQALYSADGDAANVEMSLSGQTLCSDPPVMYPINNNVDFVAYYPHTVAIGDDFTINVNVAGQAAGLPVEILYSDNVKNQPPTQTPVKLDFMYSLAKLVVTVTGGANSTFSPDDFAAMTVSIEGMYTQANLQLENGKFNDRKAKQTIEMFKTGNTATFATFEALVLPTTTTDGEITFLFNVGGHTYQHKQAAEYATHSLYRLNFALDFSSSEATVLDTYIVPRDEYTQNITVDVTTAPKMALTTARSGEVRIYMFGSGDFTIDWGDGSAIEKHTFVDFHIEVDTILYDYLKYSHYYSENSSRTITITGDNITYLSCVGYGLTSLDVGKNPKLKWLWCSNNQLTSLDVKNNPKLIMLGCDSNELTSLEANAALQSLGCGMNRLTSLDVSKSIELKGLECGNNLLTDLDLSNNTALQSLSCSNNPLTNLDLSNNIALTILTMDFISLPSIDLTNNIELERLTYRYSELTNLDVSKNTKLYWLWCGFNKLTSLDVRNNTALIMLNCEYNQLTSLDLNNNIMLTNLYCGNNHLSSLDVRNNTVLKTLDVTINQLSTSALNNLFGTLHSNNVGHKEIFIDNNPGTNTCNRSIATNRGWYVGVLIIISNRGNFPFSETYRQMPSSQLAVWRKRGCSAAESAVGV